MNTDKNTIIGFVLLAGLFFTYFWYTNKQQTEMQSYKKHFDDSVAIMKSTAEKAAALKNPAIVDTAAGAVSNSAQIDSVKEQITELENEVVKLESRFVFEIVLLLPELLFVPSKILFTVFAIF